MQPKTGKVRPVLVGAAVLAAALAVELVDELAGGVKSAALPLIRQGLDLSYGDIGLLASAPLVLGSLLELPLGILAGQGRIEDLNLLLDVANRIEGHTICGLGDAAAWPVQSFLKHFRHEFQYMIEHKGRSVVEGVGADPTAAAA